jgi:hypothetical protein
MVEWQNGGRNGGMVEWRNGGMAEWMAGLRGMTEWRSHKMAEWRNREMAGWLPTYFIYGTCQQHQHLLIFYSIDRIELNCHANKNNEFN